LTEGEKTVKKALIAAALLLGCTGQAQAVGIVADVTVHDRAENRTLPVHYHEGRYYVIGRPGNEYQVNVRNRQSGEILTVISVDGVNAVSGATADWGQTGYVLSPYTSFGIKGWRKSMQRVAAFVFTEFDRSYAARTGRPDDIGVIGVAVFRKKSEPAISIDRDFDQRRKGPASAGAPAGNVESAAKESSHPADAAPPVVPQPVLPEKSLGTGHGKSETSVVRYTSFERAATTPDEVITIYYDSYRNLAAQGVFRDSERIARPSPFPGQFVPDPR
jgi:hypothetical protein